MSLYSYILGFYIPEILIVLTVCILGWQNDSSHTMGQLLKQLKQSITFFKISDQLLLPFLRRTMTSLLLLHTEPLH